MSLPTATVPLHAWLCEPLPKDVALSIERIARTPGVHRIAVMPDVHLAEEVCVGLVVASKDRLFPRAVGGDIGCGMAALRFDAGADALASERDAARVLKALRVMVPANRHSALTLIDALPEDLRSAPLSHTSLENLKRREGRVQLGTLGRGNHFLELQADEEERLWAMVHSGSRGIGQAITDHHLRSATEEPTGLRSLDAASDSGQAYVRDVAWARAYADRNRRLMLDALAALLDEVLGVRADAASLITCDHNHVRLETHFGEEVWVHRKGAAPAREGEPGVIPGSMGTASYHVLGRGCAEALCSSSHGAGRALPRGEARRGIPRRRLEREMRGIWFDQALSEALREEAPSAYKDIGRVMAAQRELTKVVRRLRPVLSYKGV